MQDLKPTFEHYYPDGVKGGQCGIFAHKLVEFPLVGDTIETKKAAVKKFGKLGPMCQVGDVLVLDVGTKAGHITIINADKGLFWQLTESNIHLDERVHHTRLIPKTSSQIYGFFRGALKVQIYNPMITSKVSLYKSQVNPDIISKGLDILNSKLPEGFKLITNVFVTDRTFSAVEAPGYTPTKYMVDPAQILDLPADGAKVICLAHAVPNISNPFHSPTSKNGATGIQIPEYWYTTFPEIFAQYYLHELLHAYCYITGQPDKVHAGQQNNWGGLGSPTDYYISLLVELKPFWLMLADSVQGEYMVFFKVKGKPGIFEFVNNAWRGYDDPVSYGKDTAGKTVRIVELDQAEFDKLPQLFPI